MNYRIISSLEKCFLDENIRQKRTLTHASMLKNEHFSFQLAYQTQMPVYNYNSARLEIDSPLKDRIRVYRVQNLACEFPFYYNHVDADVLRSTPGLYPDALLPMEDDRLLVFHTLHSLWFEVEGSEDLPAGTYPITLHLIPLERGTLNHHAERETQTLTLTLEVIDALLPEQSTKVTNWFYCDCLQTYYNTQAFDERHWQIIESFMKTAVDHGINTILTPLLTPPLDTYVGGERPTVQLVKIQKDGDTYSFDFSLLERWVKLCNKLGVKYFEINHMFTQWGAGCCPKVMAEVNGKQERIFGWDTKSTGEEYKSFLTQLIPAFLSFMRSMDGADKRCYFHLSDEPNQKHLENYKAVRDLFLPLVEGYPVMDALSHVEFFDQGLVALPVPHSPNFADFYSRDIAERWVYYCCGLTSTNRFFGLPSHRNRILGPLMYKFGVKGFLQWGYNFYYNENSYRPLDPWVCTDGEGFGPSGDAFIVYPGRDGSCVPSLRLKVFREALQDQRALELCEKLCGRDFTLSLLDEGIEPLDFTDCPRDPDYLPRLREKVNAAIREALRT